MEAPAKPMRPLPCPTAAAATQHTNRWQNAIDCLPGLALVAVLAGLAITVGSIGWFASTGLSALTVAIVLGMLVGNTLDPRAVRVGGSGAAFAKQTLLRLGIILYGLRLTFHDIAHVPIAGLPLAFLALSTTF